MFRALIDAFKTARADQKRRKSRSSSGGGYFTVVLRWSSTYDHFNRESEIHQVKAANPCAALITAQAQAATVNAFRVSEFHAFEDLSEPQLTGPDLLRAAMALLPPSDAVIFPGKLTPQHPGDQI